MPTGQDVCTSGGLLTVTLLVLWRKLIGQFKFFTFGFSHMVKESIKKTMLSLGHIKLPISISDASLVIDQGDLLDTLYL